MKIQQILLVLLLACVFQIRAAVPSGPTGGATNNTLAQWTGSNSLGGIANGIGLLTNNGSGGFGFTTNIAQDVTYNNITTTNLTVVNQLTVSNIIVTNITVQNNLTTSNFFTVSGNHNTVIVSNSLSVQPVKTNLLATTSTGLVTNANYGTGIAWDPATLTISATATGGDTTGTNIVTLTMTGTNVSAMDFSLVQRGGVFKLQLTGNGYVGAPSNVANTSVSQCWLMVQQPSTGTCVLTFTNLYCFSEGVMPIIDTNNSAVSVFQLVSDVFTNGLVHASVSTPSKRTP